MKKLIALTLCLGGLLTSCNQRVKQERLERIDSLQTYLPAVRSVLKQVDSARIEHQLQQVRETQDWVFDNVEDTLPRQPGMILADYFRMEKYLGQSLDRHRSVQKELKYTKSQLETLRKDVEGSFYSDEEFEGYFNAEASAVEKLNDAAGELATKHETISEQYQQLRKASQHVVDSIRAVVYSDRPL